MLKKWFSFIELIIVVSILLLLAVIGMSINSTYKEKSENTRIISDISSLKNSFSQYQLENQNLPNPSGNVSYYDIESNYMHSAAGSFWVNGFVSEETLPKKYMNYTPLDPRTSQYYAYGRTIDGKSFEIAGVQKNNLDYQSVVAWNYTGDAGPLNLIREFNGPDFVYNDSSENFPYNPEERIITGKIVSFNGWVTINNAISSPDQVLNFTLREWDNIKVTQNGYANIYFSDGSRTKLWSTSSHSELQLAKMTLTNDTNLVTKIQLALNIGSLWTQAAKLNSSSEFEVYSTDTTAAVRGTVFSLTKFAGKTNITVESGKVKVWKIVGAPNFLSLNDTLASSWSVDEQPVSFLGVDTGVENGQKVSYIDAQSWVKWIDISPTSSPINDTISGSPVNDVSNNVAIRLISIDSGSKTIQLQVPNRLLTAEKIVAIIPDFPDYETKWFSIVNNILTINSTTTFTQVHTGAAGNVGTFGNSFTIKLCKWLKCTRPVDIVFSWSTQVFNQTLQTWQAEALDPCPISLPNPHENGKCYANRFARENFQLVWVVDYQDEKALGNIFTKIEPINPVTFTGGLFFKWPDSKTLWIKIIPWISPPVYSLWDLKLWENFIIEFRVRWSDMLSNNTSPWKFLLGTPTSYPQIRFRSESIWSSPPTFKHSIRISLLGSNLSLVSPPTTINPDAWYDVAIWINNVAPVWVNIPPKLFADIAPVWDPAGWVHFILTTWGVSQSILDKLDNLFIGWLPSANGNWPWVIKALKFYRKILLPKEGTTKDYIKWANTVSKTIGTLSCTGGSVSMPWNITVTCTTPATWYSSLNYTWTKMWTSQGHITPSSGTITNFTTPLYTTFDSFTLAGSYQYKLEVSDTLWNKKNALITLAVQPPNTPPFSYISGWSQTFSIFDKNFMNLSWYGSDNDPLDTIATIWSVTSGPWWANIVSPTRPQAASPVQHNTLVNNLLPWTYNFNFLVTDSKGLSNSSNLSVTLTNGGKWCAVCPGGLNYISDPGGGGGCFIRVMTHNPREWKCSNVNMAMACWAEWIYGGSCSQRDRDWSGMPR